MQKTIFRTKSTIPCRDDAELASEQTYQTAFTAWQEQPGNEFSFRQPGTHLFGRENEELCHRLLDDYFAGGGRTPHARSLLSRDTGPFYNYF